MPSEARKITPQVKFFLTLAKCFTDLAKLFSINCELDFINIAMPFSFSLDSDNYFCLARHPYEALNFLYLHS